MQGAELVAYPVEIEEEEGELMSDEEVCLIITFFIILYLTFFPDVE